MVWTQKEKIILPIVLMLIVILVVFLGTILRNKNDKIKNYPFMAISLFLIFLEIIKQSYAIHLGYGFWSLPLHFCSYFLVWFFLAAFGKGKVKRFGHIMSYYSGAIFIIAFYINPNAIIGSSTENILQSISTNDFFGFHTFTYHHFITVFFLLQIILDQYRPKHVDIYSLAIGMAVILIVSTVVSNITDTNFINLLYNQNEVIDIIRINYGYPVYLLTMYLVAFAGGSLLLTVETLVLEKIIKDY